MRFIWVLSLFALTACGDGSAAESATPATRTATAPAHATADQPGERTFRDWSVVCDNANTCSAFGHASEGTGWIRISIPAGHEGQPDVAFGFWPDDGSHAGTVSAEVDGKVFAASLDPNAGDDAPIGMVEAGVVRGLIAAMNVGQEMTVRAGPQSVRMSLSGVAASMLWIDERQGRLGTTTALIREGDRPASAVPAAPDLPVVTPAAAVSQGPYGDQAGQTLPAAISALPDVVACRGETAFNPDLQDEIVSARLDANTVLWSVPCGAGAYNFSYAYFTIRPDGTNPRRLTFPSTGEPMDLLVNAAYDPVTRVIDEFYKGRGLGDCGRITSWAWTDRGFILASSTSMSECNGMPSEYWPSVWVTR